MNGLPPTGEQRTGVFNKHSQVRDVARFPRPPQVHSLPRPQETPCREAQAKREGKIAKWTSWCKVTDARALFFVSRAQTRKPKKGLKRKKKGAAASYLIGAGKWFSPSIYDAGTHICEGKGGVGGRRPKKRTSNIFMPRGYINMQPIYILDVFSANFWKKRGSGGIVVFLLGCHRIAQGGCFRGGASSSSKEWVSLM